MFFCSFWPKMQLFGQKMAFFITRRLLSVRQNSAFKVSAYFLYFFTISHERFVEEASTFAR